MTEVEVVSDSELMVKQMRGEYRVKNLALQELFLEAGRLARAVGCRDLHSVRREHNELADRLLNDVLDATSEIFGTVTEGVRVPGGGLADGDGEGRGQHALVFSLCEQARTRRSSAPAAARRTSPRSSRARTSRSRSSLRPSRARAMSCSRTCPGTAKTVLARALAGSIDGAP